MILFNILPIIYLLTLLTSKSKGFGLNRASSEDHLKKDCDDVEPIELRTILGPAFNPRYMSIRPPQLEITPNVLKLGLKRTTGDYSPDFYVDDDYQLIESDKPAWESDNFEFTSRTRRQQNTAEKNLYKVVVELERMEHNDGGIMKPWVCPSNLLWLDLGRDYYPRYIRTIECLSKSCWYGYYECKPRSFTVRLLRRRQGQCALKSNERRRIGNSGLDLSMRELWVWEERAINFCCDCRRKDN